jgi:hypothetical protein
MQRWRGSSALGKDGTRWLVSPRGWSVELRMCYSSICVTEEIRDRALDRYSVSEDSIRRGEYGIRSSQPIQSTIISKVCQEKKS